MNEGCNGGFPFLVGRHAFELGVFQKTSSVSGASSVTAAGRCNADSDAQPLSGACSQGCLSPDPSAQPVYFAADYGYVGGFAQGASEAAIMWELYDHGPLSIELSVRAIPMLIN